MLLERYPIFQVSLPSDAFESNEFRGSRAKFWIQVPGKSNSWLLKFPRPGVGEHWAEKVSYEIGNLMGINCARVELARYEGQMDMFSQSDMHGGTHEPSCQSQLATICEDFISDAQSRSDLSDKEAYTFHGSEILRMLIEGYNINLQFGQREHNVKNIASALTTPMGVGSLNPMSFWDMELQTLVSYALLDGIIGNTDRHHENWMVAYIFDQNDARIEVLPSFDHASSLGRELTDQRRRQIIEADTVLNYLHRGRGGVFVDSNRRRALSPLRLAQLLCRWRPDFTQAICARIADVSDEQIRLAIDKVPSEFMSDIAKEFAHRVIVTGRNELLQGVL